MATPGIADWLENAIATDPTFDNVCADLSELDKMVLVQIAWFCYPNKTNPELIDMVKKKIRPHIIKIHELIVLVKQFHKLIPDTEGYRSFPVHPRIV
jgi:hypothetical protein